MSEYCYVGSAEAVCDLNIKPYTIELSCLPYDFKDQWECDEPILLGGFEFTKWYGVPHEFWLATSSGTSGNDVINGNGLLAAIEASNPFAAIAQAANGTYLGDKVFFQISGGDGDDVITGGANADTLCGGNGNDVLNGLRGSDKVYGDGGNDTINGGDDNDWVDGGADSDVVNGDAGDDNVVGGTGSDTVNGGDGHDNLFGDTDGMTPVLSVVVDDHDNYYAPETPADGNDVMDGGIGNDMMFGQGGQDTMMGGVGDDGMDGGSGNDSMSGGDGIDNMTGGCGNDIIRGDNGNDIINAGDGDDKVMGGLGSDWMTGGKGDDTLTGGSGADHFVFCEDCGCNGDDWITDFATNRPRDQIDLTQLFNLDLVISAETGEDKSAFLELISFGNDRECGGGDDYSMGTIYVNSKQNIAHVFGLDSTFGTSARSLVRVNEYVLIDLPSDSFVYNGEIA